MLLDSLAADRHRARRTSTSSCSRTSTSITPGGVLAACEAGAAAAPRVPERDVRRRRGGVAARDRAARARSRVVHPRADRAARGERAARARRRRSQPRRSATASGSTAAPGTRPGSCSPRSTMPGGPVVFAADLIPGRAWVHLPITMGYDRYPELLIDEKAALLGDLEARGGRLFFTHDPEVALGTVAQATPGGRSHTVDERASSTRSRRRRGLRCGAQLVSRPAAEELAAAQRSAPARSRRRGAAPWSPARSSQRPSNVAARRRCRGRCPGTDRRGR